MEGTCRARECARYQPRRASESVLYRCVQEHLATWLAHSLEGHDDDGPVLKYVEREFRQFTLVLLLVVSAFIMFA